MKKEKREEKSSRRGFLSKTAFSAGGLLFGLTANSAARVKENSAPEKKKGDELSMRSDGTYEVVPLEKKSVNLAVIQSRIRAVDGDNPKPGIKANLAHMLELIDKAFFYGSRPDILFFHEFPITGWSPWTRKQILNFALNIPGPETDEIAKKAKKYGCYIVFGSYAKDENWKNHVLSITTIIGKNGEIIDKHWKARNIKGVFPNFELFTTTIYDVFDRYVEMYGIDEVIPVTRTPYGNIATSSVQREPELFRAFAMKGAEMILRTASGGFTPLDVWSTAFYDRVYTAICSNAYSPENPGFFDDAGSGGSAVYAPGGDLIAEAKTKFETKITARIPIADYRRRNRQPTVHMELYKSIYEKYKSPYGPNLFSEYQPKDLQDAKRYLNDKTRWKRR